MPLQDKEGVQPHITELEWNLYGKSAVQGSLSRGRS